MPPCRQRNSGELPPCRKRNTLGPGTAELVAGDVASRPGSASCTHGHQHGNDAQVLHRDACVARVNSSVVYTV